MKFILKFTLAVAVASIAPVIATPADCSQNYDGSFQITAVKPSAKRSLTKRDSTCKKEGYLTLTLHDGQLIDSKGRAGYIASNYQFQFDQPPQENADSVGGYSACNNGSLALGSSTIFYQCLSGNFYNLYDRHWAAQCQPTYIDILPCNDDSSSSRHPVSQIDDGQPQASSATARIPVSQIPDGQPQAPTATARAPISQISDGQPQAPVTTETAYSPPDTYTQPAITGSPITQISDGQPQAPPATLRTSPVASASNPNPNSVETTNPSTPITAGSSLNKASSFGAFILAATAAAFFL